MPLLPWRFSARTWRWCCAGCCGCATRYSAAPTVIFASATTASPAATAVRAHRTDRRSRSPRTAPRRVRARSRCGSPRCAPTSSARTARRYGVRPGAEAARVMADLIAEGARTLTFVRSRRGAELTALGARARLEDIAPELAERVASYRAGYLAEDRRALERALAEGELRGLATTNALELGVDIAGLDAVVLAGFPGTVTSFWQQAGRSGRRGPGRADRAHRARRPVGHLPGAPPGSAVGQADRTRGDRPRKPLCTWTPVALRSNRVADRRRRGAGVEGRARWRPPSSTTGC